MINALAPLVANPIWSLAIALLLCGLYLLAFYLQRVRSLGSAWLVTIAPMLWLFNTAWEITRFGKDYSPTYDLHYWYPTLVLCSVLAIGLWLLGMLSQLTTAGESREDKIALHARDFLRRVLRVVFAFLPVEFLDANRIFLVFPALLGGFLFFIVGLAATRTFGGALQTAFSAIFFISSFEILMVVLYRFQCERDAHGSLNSEIGARVQAVDEYVSELGNHILRFEALAVDKFHAVTKHANEVFHRAKHIHSHLDHRLQALKSLVAVGKPAEIEAAKELLEHEIDIRQNVLEGLLVADAKRALPADEWEMTARHLSGLLEEVLDQMEKAPGATPPRK